MNKTNQKLTFLLIAILFFANCSTDDPVDKDLEGTTKELAGISEETKNSIPVDQGEIGIAIDTRRLASLGYKPTKVNLVIDGALSTYSQNDIAVDQYTNLAMFRIAAKDISETVIASFDEGVKITATVFDENGNVLESQVASSAIIDADNRHLRIETVKPIVLEARAYNPNISYYLQCVSGPGGADVSIENPLFLGAKTIDETNGSEVEYYDRGTMGLTFHDPTPESPYAQSQKFYFERIQENTFAIRLEFEKCYLESNNGFIYWDKSVTDNSLLEDKHKFMLDFTEDGYVTITPYIEGSPLQVFTSGPKANIVQTEFLEDNEDLKFRVLSTDVTWEYETIDTKFSKPIIPATKMQFGAEVTVVNCSDATIVKTFGIEKIERSEFTTTSEESVQLYGSQKDSWSATVTASASGTFFGIGASLEASGTLAGETETGFSNEYTTQTDVTKGEEQKFSEATEVTVPPNSAIEFYNATQIIENVNMPFVTRIRIRGAEGEQELTGPEIVSQIVTSRFPGVVTEIGENEGDNFVVVSIRGNIKVDQYFKTTSSADNIDGACD